jgi:hypothetical protein
LRRRLIAQGLLPSRRRRSARRSSGLLPPPGRRTSRRGPGLLSSQRRSARPAERDIGRIRPATAWANDFVHRKSPYNCVKKLRSPMDCTRRYGMIQTSRPERRVRHLRIVGPGFGFLRGRKTGQIIADLSKRNNEYDRFQGREALRRWLTAATEGPKGRTIPHASTSCRYLLGRAGCPGSLHRGGREPDTTSAASLRKGGPPRSPRKKALPMVQQRRERFIIRPFLSSKCEVTAKLHWS